MTHQWCGQYEFCDKMPNDLAKLWDQDLPKYMLEMESVPLEQGVAEADLVVIATDHDCIDWQKLVRDAKLVVDARNATRHVTFGRDKIKSA